MGQAAASTTSAVKKTIYLFFCGGDKRARTGTLLKPSASRRGGPMKKIEVAAWDSAEVLNTAEAIEEYLAAAFETEDPVFIANALGIVARARKMSELARNVGMTRAALYRAFSGETSPQFATIMKIMQALAIRIAPVVKKAEDAA